MHQWLPHSLVRSQVPPAPAMPAPPAASRPRQEPQGEPEPSHPWLPFPRLQQEALFQALSQWQGRLLLDVTINGVAQLVDGKAGIPQVQPQTATVLCNNNIWPFPSLLFYFYFSLKPKNTDGMGIFPDRVEALPVILHSKTGALPLQTSSHGWELTSARKSSAAMLLPLKGSALR